jgi:hypothetical protein
VAGGRSVDVPLVPSGITHRTSMLTGVEVSQEAITSIIVNNAIRRI